MRQHARTSTVIVWLVRALLPLLLFVIWPLGRRDELCWKGVFFLPKQCKPAQFMLAVCTQTTFCAWLQVCDAATGDWVWLGSLWVRGFSRDPIDGIGRCFLLDGPDGSVQAPFFILFHIPINDWHET